jgi:hypothetical protein
MSTRPFLTTIRHHLVLVFSLLMIPGTAGGILNPSSF